ncbi:MAG: transketolase [Myxococcaceae bacterium]|nr:transketolase [Myxococcaceae bacterium]
MTTFELAQAIRRDALKMVARANASHIGSALSVTDVLAVLYGGVLRVDPAAPLSPDRDRLVFSKGHACTALYAALANRGFFPMAWLETFSADGSRLLAHVSSEVPGVELSTGSLGHGLSVACGLALSLRARRAPSRVYAVLSDGECDEGSTWEAALFAGHHRLENLTVIVDANGIQSFGKVSEVLELEPFLDKWRAFGFDALEVDGHDHGALGRALASDPGRTKPRAVIARTVKGKGVDYMEGRLEWHYRSPNPTLLEQALAQVAAAKEPT